MAGADEADLLGAEQREDQRAVERAGGGERPGEADDDGGAGGVVVGAGVERAAHHAEVIVVGAEHDGLGRARGIAAGQHADHVDGGAVGGLQRHPDLGGDADRQRGRGSSLGDRLGQPRGGDAGRGQQRVGAGRRQRAGDEAHRGGGRDQRRQPVGDDQQRPGARAARGDELVEPARPGADQVRRRALQRDRDAPARVHAGPVVVAGLGRADPVADEDDLAGDGVAQRPAVRRPVATGLDPRRSAGQRSQRGPGRDARPGGDDERLEERLALAARPQARRLQPVGELAGGEVAARCAGAASLHAGAGERVGGRLQLARTGRDECRTGDGDGGEEREDDGEQRDAAAAHRAILP